jgi:site-specific recombinase XerD
MREAHLAKPASCYTLRHSFAAHLLEAGHDIRTLEEVLGHKDLRITIIYTHVVNRGGKEVRNPLRSRVNAPTGCLEYLPIEAGAG